MIKLTRDEVKRISQFVISSDIKHEERPGRKIGFKVEEKAAVYRTKKRR
jgi:hypothetical protein